MIVLVYRFRQKISAKICGRKHGTLVETKHGLNGNSDQLTVKFTANPSYDTAGRHDMENMYVEVKDDPGTRLSSSYNGSPFFLLVRKLRVLVEGRIMKTASGHLKKVHKLDDG